MSDFNDDPYKTPEATLTTAGEAQNILDFQRFSAWGVFGLTIITLGIYSYYWMYSRMPTINAMHKDKISKGLLINFLVVTVLYYASSFVGETEAAIIFTLGITLIYMVLYIIVVFKMRNRLQDIMNQSSNNQYQLGSVLTFFFNAIYFQYKINECIDDVNGVDV